MRNERVTEAYRLYYENVLSKDHNNPDLLARWGRDPSTLETQILCHKHGAKVADSAMFTEDGEVFGPARWPYNAKTEPNYSDPPIQYTIGKRMRAIGSTWWDWKNRRSIGLGFDFDSVIDHPTEGVGIEQHEIDKLDNIDVPWLEIVRSTRGNGRHIYIWFQEPYPITLNHDEHSALARCLLPMIGQATGFNVEGDVDCFGAVLWFHHENATKENQGYALVKPATQFLSADDVPANWRDNIEVVSGGRSKVRVQGWTADGLPTDGDELDEMTQAHAKTPLEPMHMDILEALEGTGHSSLWVHDHHLWQGHTGGLKQVFDEWAEAGKPMKGLFDTNSYESDPGKPNCFMRPKPGGGWDVYRFGDNTGECELWGEQGKWTHITYNHPATLRQICLACGGFEASDAKIGFQFSAVEEIAAALKMLKSSVDVPKKAYDDEERTFGLRPRLDGKVVLIISKQRKDKPKDFPRFTKQPKGWERVIDDAIETTDKEQEDDQMWSELDNKFRALKSAPDTGEATFEGWVLRDETEKWITHPRENLKSYLMAQGFEKVDPVLGGAIYKSWTLVNEPFQSEYPGGRMWNRNAAQLRFTPLELAQGEVPRHPHWDRVMNHCGCDLDEYLPELDWPKQWGITNGGDYLKAWVACMIRNPFGKLPYLFMYGPQNSGKSIFHEAVSLLMTKGVVKADKALTSDQGYNGELSGAVLAVVDEVDISKSGMMAYNRLKEWTTGLTLSIHAKYKQVHEVRSTLHFCQMANTRKALPVFPGDKRITAVNVPSLEEEIPKERLLELLTKEAPAFMRTIVDMDIPEAIGRLMVPVIETRGKAEAVIGNMDPFERFLDDRCFRIPGGCIKLSEFKEKFWKDIEQVQRDEYGIIAIKNRLSELDIVVGRLKANSDYIGNLSFTECEPGVPFVLQGNRLVREE